MSEVSQIACTHCRNGWFEGTEVECVNGVLIDIDEAHEGWHRDVIYPPAPCISQSEDWPDGDRGCQERLDEWAAQGKTMTDRQTAVEAMARAFVRAKGNDPDAELKLCGVGPRRPAWQHIEGPIHEALDALLGHLAAHGGQIVPKSFPQYREENGVAWQDEKLLEVIEQADEAYRKAQVHSTGGQTVDAAWGRKYGRMLAAVRVLLAAASSPIIAE